jgi:hypothetical protein
MTRSEGKEREEGDDDLPPRVARGLWPTAVVQDSKSAARHTTTTDTMHPGTMLLDAVRAWSTPRATEGEKGGPSGRDGSGSPHLCSVAADFPTPSATEYGSSQNGINGKGGEFERPSAGTPSLSTAARKGALPGGAKGVLNPGFVEALMGWPLGWSDPEAPAGRSVPFPPPPRDTDGWARYLAENPEAIPAVPSGAVRRRVDRLRACGNGVVPAQAAAAFGELFGALGFAASTDQGSESRTQSPRTRGCLPDP